MTDRTNSNALARHGTLWDKLLKTADGVPVHEGMELWWYDKDNGLCCTKAVAIQVLVPFLGGIGPTTPRPTKSSYSTREAAEAAKAKGE